MSEGIHLGAMDREQIAQILVDVLPELHALAWLEPFNNSADRGRWDPGWSCRDHSIVLAALLTASGVPAEIVNGMSVYVQGPTSAGDEAIGLGNDLRQGGGHTWINVPGFGTIDVSPRLDQRVQHWRPLDATGLVGDNWPVGNLASQVVIVDNAPGYARALDVATNMIDTATAIYWPKDAEVFRADMLDVKYIDSPLAHRLAQAAGTDSCLKLAAHLFGLRRGTRRPLNTVAQRKAWRFLGQVDHELIDEFNQAITAH